MKDNTSGGLEAFCQTRPDPERVTQLLKQLGFHLDFSMPECNYSYGQTPTLPAQYHYEDGQGTQAIYLAGRDANTDEIFLPPHASRFWLYAGRNIDRYQLVRQILASWWQLPWQPVASSAEEVSSVA